MYHAPLRDMRFVLGELLGAQELASLPRYAEFSMELADSILEEAGRFAEEVLAPINRLGDTGGAQYRDGAVRMPAEFRAAYAQFVAAGWPELSIPPARGGQGAPLVLAVAAEECWFGANLAFMLCPQLSRGAIDALEKRARLVAEVIGQPGEEVQVRQVPPVPGRQHAQRDREVLSRRACQHIFGTRHRRTHMLTHSRPLGTATSPSHPASFQVMNK